MWAYATPPGGIVATFIDSFDEPTFLALSPTRYWILFQLRQLSPPRITEIPSPPSTNWRRSSPASASASRELERMGSRFLFPRHETIGAAPAGYSQPGPAPIVSVRLRSSLTVR